MKRDGAGRLATIPAGNEAAAERILERRRKNNMVEVYGRLRGYEEEHIKECRRSRCTECRDARVLVAHYRIKQRRARQAL